MHGGLALARQTGRTLRRGVRINAGRDVADQVVIGDPETGVATVALLSRTNRIVDRLFHEGKLTPDQHAWAIELYESWVKAGLGSGGHSTVGFGRSGGRRDIIHNEEAYAHWLKAMKGLGDRNTSIVKAVIVHDEDPVQWGAKWRCDGLGYLKRCLDRLGVIWGRT